MMKTLLLVAASAALLYAGLVESLPNGAPAGACDTLTPLLNPMGHSEPPQTSPVPYSIDLSPFNNSGVWEYTPGTVYTLTFSGNDDLEFRGFFFQSRLVADDSRTGSFGIVDADNSRLSNCTPANVGLTHTNRGNKTSMSFRWTAPPTGTGDIRFRFAVVQVQVVYWADQSTQMIAEADSGAAQLTSAGFWTILMVALGVVLKEAM